MRGDRRRAFAVPMLLFGLFLVTTMSAGSVLFSGPAGAGTSVAGYRNPFRAVHNLVAERIDEGVDYSGTGPVHALGKGQVVYVNSTGQWFPPAPDYIAYRLSGGAAKGFTVYIGECITINVHVGELITTKTVLGDMFDCGYGIEIGWANGHRLPDASAAKCYRRHDNAGGDNPSGYGMNFSALLARLGAPPGRIVGTPICPMPPGARPSW